MIVLFGYEAILLLVNLRVLFVIGELDMIQDLVMSKLQARRVLAHLDRCWPWQPLSTQGFPFSTQDTGPDKGNDHWHLSDMKMNKTKTQRSPEIPMEMYLTKDREAPSTVEVEEGPSDLVSNMHHYGCDVALPCVGNKLVDSFFEFESNDLTAAYETLGTPD